MALTAGIDRWHVVLYAGPRPVLHQVWVLQNVFMVVDDGLQVKRYDVIG